MHHRTMRAGLVLMALLGLTTTGVSEEAKPKDAILLSKVQSLTLRAGKKTSHRRVPAIPQLRCVSSPRVCALHTVGEMECKNQGSSHGAENIDWSCTASLPPELKLGATDVVCEGYAGADDPYVLRGSCGVEYRLVLTDLGEQKFPGVATAGSRGWSSFLWGEDEADSVAWLFGILFVSVLLWILYSWMRGTPPPAEVPRRGNRWLDGGGGGGFDPGFGPGGGGGGGGGYGRYGYDPPPPYGKSRQNEQRWYPGFWSGMAGGAATAAYLARNRAARGEEDDEEPLGFYGGGSSSGWGSDSGAGSMSSWRYTSTGFGSTSRR